MGLRAKLVLIAGIFLAVATATFFSVRAFTGESATQAGGPSPDQEDAAIAEGKAQLEDLEARVADEVARQGGPFYGVFNGVRFVKDTGPDDPGVPGCVLEEAAPEEVAASPLNFTIADPDFTPGTGVGAGSCRGRLVSLGGPFQRSGGGEAGIGRFAGPPFSSRTAPQGYLEAVEVSGKPAVLIRDVYTELGQNLFPGEYYHNLIIVEDFGSTHVTGRGLTRAELFALAEAIHGCSQAADWCASDLPLFEH